MSYRDEIEKLERRAHWLAVEWKRVREQLEQLCEQRDVAAMSPEQRRKLLRVV